MYSGKDKLWTHWKYYWDVIREKFFSQQIYLGEQENLFWWEKITHSNLEEQHRENKSREHERKQR